MSTTPPTTAREALELVWKLAHEMKEGQEVPIGTECISKVADGEFVTYRSLKPFDGVRRPGWAEARTFDPLPDPEPDWLDAPAVMARPEDDTWVAVWQPCEAPWCSGATRNESRWVSPRGGAGCRSWRELTDVTPLYPKEQDDLNPSNSMGIEHEETDR